MFLISGVNCGFKTQRLETTDSQTIQFLEDHRGYRYKLINRLRADRCSDMELYMEINGEWDLLAAAQGTASNPHPDPDWALIYMLTEESAPSKLFH